MFVNFPLLRRRFRRLIQGHTTDLADMASQEWTLCPNEVTDIKPAVYLDGALEKVTALSPWRTWDVELALIRGGIAEHAASTAHLIENVDLVGAYIYKGAGKLHPGFGAERVIVTEAGRSVELDEANLVTSWPGSHFFGPFLKCDLPLELINEGSTDNISMVTREYHHASGYRRLCGLAPVPVIRRAHIKKLTVYTDFAQNSFKVERYRKLRSQLRSKLDRRHSPPIRGTYLLRGKNGELRNLDNEADIVNLLQGMGFEIIETDKLNAAEIAERTRDAPIVISVEGSHLSHVIFTLQDHGTMLVLQPPDRFAMPYKEFTDSLQMDFAFLVGTKTENGFSIALDELRRILDKIS